MNTGSSQGPPGDSPEDNRPSHTGDSPSNRPSHSDSPSVGPIRRTGVFIKHEDIEEADLDRSSLSGLRKHNYYNAKNAAKVLALLAKWHGMAYIDCNMSASALGLTPDSLRLKILCGKYYIQDNMKTDENTARVLSRMIISSGSGGIVLRMSAKETDVDFVDLLKPGTGSVDPCEEFVKWLESKPRPRMMFTLRDLDLTEGQLEWFRQTCAQIKSEYEADINKKQVVVIKLI